MAFEMARQLQALGEEVEVLVLVDVGPPGVAGPQASRTGGVLGRLRHYHRTGRVVDAVKWRLGLAWELFALPYVGRGETRRTAANRARHRRIHQRYEPTPIEGDALLVRSSEYDGLETRESHLEWSRLLSGNLSVAVVPGTHAGLVENRYARELAYVIGQRLSRVRTSKRLDRDPRPGVDQESVVAPTINQESAAFR
jgi:thioesterase domain-containing protein